MMGSGTQTYVSSTAQHFSKTKMLMKSTERHNNQMDNPRRPLRHLLRMVYRRLHSRKTTLEERPTVAWISSGRSSFPPLHPFPLLILYLHLLFTPPLIHLLTPVIIVPNILLRTQTPWPSPPKPLHFLPPRTTILPTRTATIPTTSRRTVRRTSAYVQWRRAAAVFCATGGE